ncbi:tol-pal system protein YbgF [Thiobacillus sp. 65-1402]|uniref:tol-pal system protein YbgF n=1 Tax=Thiobacillus sp. 65-1402 TaxID=1895861 RepID=UPI000928C3C4|nr:tol-pal system protein YbgF [Thiobacillus sp. 65-1402]OJW46142.1 MAG: tol-pal system protein YbgF [Thiobacillus sp. 65-1059]OJW76487.1 MAG: tol-pal system protein YbgF [Thiobacillus sp. 65-1402]
MRYALILASVFALAQPARADTAELARQVQALDTRLGKLEGAMLQNQQLLGLLTEVEALKAEIARLRGQAEVQVHQLDTLGKRQNDLYVDLDQRLTDLAKAARPAPVAAAVQPAAPPSAPAAAPAPAVAAAATPADPQLESRSYEAALGHFREANYAGAIAGFKGFLKAYPDSALASNAQYWIGYSYYALKDYKSALAHQQKLVAAYPASAKVPDAQLNIAASQIALDNIDGARKTLEELVAKYPGTNAANIATRRLAAFK